MRVRISGNSIRFRLRQSEVQRFGKHREIKEVISFGSFASEKLSFVLKSIPSNYFQVSYKSNAITVEVPEALCKEWTQTALVGFNETVDTDKGEAISILVEKDFACLDGTEVENEDAYPNPNHEC